MKKLFKPIKRFVRGVLSVSELGLWRTCRRGGAGAESRRVTVIQDCHVGDFLVALPFFQRLADFFGRKLTLVSDKRVAPLALASGCFDEVVALDMKCVSSYLHPLRRWRTFRRLRQLDSKVLVQKYAVGGTALEDIFAVVIPAAEKIGVESEKTVSNGGCRLYGRLLRKNFTRLYRYDPALNLLENENAFADMICGRAESDPVGTLECFEPLPERDVELGRYALFIPGADDARRRWEPEKFAYVAERFLTAHPECRVLLSGTAGERGLMEQVRAGVSEKVREQVTVRTAQKEYLSSLKRLFSDVKHAEFVLTGDTAPLHIAAKYHVKCYCITGGWHWGYFSPCREYENVTYLNEAMPCYGCFGVCVHPGVPFRCLRELSAETVWQTIRNEAG